MSTVNDIYQVICYDLFEDGGLILGLLTVQQFIDLVNLALTDFVQRTCPSSLVQTQAIFAGTGRYTYPDTQMRVDDAFLAGMLLEPTTIQSLNNGARGWRTELNLPTRWHADELPLKTIELVSIPNYTGTYVEGPDQPDPPYAQTGWNVVLNGVTYTPSQHQDMTLVGPQLPATVSQLTHNIGFGSPTAPTALLPSDLVTTYIAFGVLARIWSSDSELKNDSMAAWAQGEFEEGIAIMAAIMGEVE